MKSPRFDMRAPKLREIFAARNIERVWKNKVRLSLRGQYVSDAIEHFDFHVQRKLECKKLSQVILSGRYVPQRGQRILVEKNKGLCRQLVIPSINDALVLQCLADFLFVQIKDKAPTKKSFFEMKDHRFGGLANEYGMFAAWLNFQKTLFNFSKEREFIIITDVANYYDSISYEHLRNVISSVTDAEECVLDMLIFVMSALLWQPDYTPRVEIGLPQMNLDAPRLLAHCFLYELDSYINTNGDIDFVRFMDDIDIGVNTIAEARKVLMSIDLVLQTKQIRLNSGKTNILSKEEAREYFRIDENGRLDELTSIVDWKIANGIETSDEKKIVHSSLTKGLKSGAFDKGYGEKVLKRWIGLAGKIEVSISLANLETLILTRPGVRQTVFNYIQKRPLTVGRARVLAKCAASDLLVDEAARVDLTNYLVETLVMRRSAVQSEVDTIISNMDPRTYYGFYCRLWLQSKYSTALELIDTITQHWDTWVADERLGRLVGSFRSILVGTPEHERFLKLGMRAQNPGFLATNRFQQALSTKAETFNAMYRALETPNPSRATGITHPKFLCLMSALQNPNVSLIRKEKLREENKQSFQDAYYRSIAGRAD